MLWFRAMRFTTTFALLVAATLIACNGSSHETKPAAPAAAAKPSAPPPTTDEAKTLLANSAEFSEYEFTHAAYTLPLSKAAMNPEARKAAADLKAAGWIRFDGAGTVVLSEKAKSDKRWLVRQNGVVDLVPLARKEVTGVTSVRPQPDGNVAVDFTWKWIANEIGSAFRSGPVHDRYAAGEQKATATLFRDADAWSVLRIVAAP